jgi:hypothetical protein
MTQTEFNHLLSQIKALPPEQVRQLRQQIDALAEPRKSLVRPSATKARPPKAATPKKPLTVAEFHQKLLAEGRISHLPDTAADYDDPDDQPITIEGEPLSETIIRERR